MNRRTTAAIGALALGAVLQAQAPQREVPKPQEFTQSQDDNLFSLPRSQEDIHSWEQSLQDMADGKHKESVERLHRLLQGEMGGVAAVAPGRYLSLRLCTLLALANLPPLASAAYEDLVKREAGSLLRRPVPELPVEVLQILADRYPASEPGRQARLRLGDLCLEAGDGNGAIGHFRQALDAVPIGSTLERKVVDRMRAAAVVQRPGDFRHHKPVEQGSGDVLTALPVESDEPGWPSYAGGSGGRTPMVDPIGTPRSQWTEVVSAPGFEIDNGPWAMHATGDLSAIYVATGVRLVAFDPLRKTTLWASPAPLEQNSTDIASAMRPYQGGNINQDMVLAAAYGTDVVVAALQVPEASNNVQFRNAFHIMSKIPERRLFAFQRASGKLLWSHFDKLGGPVDRKFRGHSVCAPPMVVGNLVYVPTHDRSGAIAFYLSCYDLNDGRMVWRRLVCSSQQEVNMFGNARSEFAASPLCLQDGVLYGSSNLGVVYAVDQYNGRLRWAHAYEVTPLPPTQFHGQQDRPVYFANNAPTVANGVMACTPIDSMYALGIDAETGTGLWQMPFTAKANGNNDVRWLVGSIESEGSAEFIFAGAGVVAVRARPKGGRFAEVRQLQRREFLNDHNQGRNLLPRPAASAEFLYYPSFGRLSIFDHDGNMAPHNTTIRLQQPGNVLLVDGMLVCLKDGNIDFQYDPEALLLRAEARLRTDDSDPAAILRLATLRRALQTGSSSADDLYRRGLAAADKRGLPADHPVRTALLQELFDSTYARALQQKDAALLRSARDMAPGASAWTSAQLQLIALLDKDPRAQDAELRLLAERQGSQRHMFAEVGNLPVRAWVLWQLARRQEEPAAAVAAWQELLEQYPDEQIAGTPAHELCRAAIARFIEQKGKPVYAEVEARAKAALEQAGTNVEKLRSIAVRFPHSDAAMAARRRLMDAAVERGDLGAAAEMLAQSLASGEPSPGILRRTIAAATSAGNRALAQKLAERLRATAAAAKSDYPADRGRSFGEVATELLQGMSNDAVQEPMAVPEEVLLRIPPRAPHATYRLPAVLRPDGFPREGTAPVYVVHQGELLLAFDPAKEKPDPLFQLKVSFLETLCLCGNVLVVPDLSAVSGHDHRTGAKLWELPNPSQRIYECLGVQGGILHLAAQTAAADASLELFGVEPLTGKVLFRRELDPRRHPTYPKAAAGQLLLLEAEPSKLPVVHRLDALTGLPATSVTLQELDKLGLRPEVLGMSRLFPQLLQADADRLYLPVDGPQTNGAPCIGAFDGDGKLVWHWTGTRGRRILMAGLRGERMAIVEAGARGSDKAGGKIAILHTRDGLAMRELELGDSVQLPLNWHRSWLSEPAPPLLLLTDRTADKSAGRRLIAMALDDALPSFQQTLGAEDGEGIATPVLGQGFLAFGVKPVQRGPLRLYAVQLADRRAAFAGGRKMQPIAATGPYEMAVAGPYTVISAAEGLFLLGQLRKNR